MKNKFQNVEFNTIDDFLEFLPSSELKIVEVLRNLIFSSIPDCREKLAYNVPFYYKKKNICFIWPSSIKWGNMKERGVRMGFSYGYLIQDDISFLDKGERKQVYWKDFYRPEDIDIDLLKYYLFEAARIDNLNKSAAKRK